MATTKTSQGILADSQSDAREHVIELLTKAYWMEVETVMSYLAASTNPDGVRAREIVESLEEDVDEELGHARQFAARELAPTAAERDRIPRFRCQIGLCTSKYTLNPCSLHAVTSTGASG